MKQYNRSTIELEFNGSKRLYLSYGQRQNLCKTYNKFIILSTNIVNQSPQEKEILHKKLTKQLTENKYKALFRYMPMCAICEDSEQEVAYYAYIILYTQQLKDSCITFEAMQSYIIKLAKEYNQKYIVFMSVDTDSWLRGELRGVDATIIPLLTTEIYTLGYYLKVYCK